MNRIEKHFMKEQKVLEKTLEWLKSFKA
jgi:hypothetical protein